MFHIQLCQQKAFDPFFGFNQGLLNLPTCPSSLIKQQHILTWLSHLAKVLANVRLKNLARQLENMEVQCCKGKLHSPRGLSA